MAGTTEGGDFRYPYEYTTVAHLLDEDRASFVAAHMDRDRALEDFLSNLRTHGPFITVAASDSPDDVRENAMFECDGTADEEEIQEALVLANAHGGTVHLLGGTFTLSASVTGAGKAAVKGSGPETEVVAPSGDYAFKTVSGQEIWSISDMTITVGAGATGGVFFDHSGGFVVDNVIVTGPGSSGYGIRCGGPSNAAPDGMVVGCTFSSLERGIYSFFSPRWRYLGNRFVSCTIGIYVQSTSHLLIEGNYFNLTQQHAILGTTMHDSLVVGNFIKDASQAANNTYSGIRIAGFRNAVLSNIFRADAANKAAYGVTLDASFSDNWVSSNDFLGFYVTAAILDNGSSNITWPGNRPFSGGTPVYGHTIEEGGTPLTQRSVLNFADGIVASDDGSETDVNIDYATTEIADVAATESAGVSAKVPRADHVHAHPPLASGDLHPEYLQESLADAKGDLIAASAADTFVRVAVGTDGQVLTADSSAAGGVAWADASGGSSSDIEALLWMIVSP